MSCGCNNKGGDKNTPKQSFDRVSVNTPPCNPDSAVMSGCQSTKGLLYDKITEQFTVPAVGKEAYIYVCEAARWSVGQFIAVDLGSNKIAVFKITDRRAKKIKVLNGCDKSGLNPIFGNPDPGYVIASNSIIYPTPPSGCESDLAKKIIDTITQFGAEALRNLLADETSICFTNVPEISEDEEGHLFVGTKPDCDCAPESLVSSCFRKALKIFTGNAGRTLCFSEVPQAALNDPDDTPKVAMFGGENNCLQEGPTLGEIRACGNYIVPTDGIYNAVLGCKEGESVLLVPTKDYQGIFSRNTGTTQNPVWVWQVQDNTIERAVINYQTSSGVGGGDAASPAKQWYTRPINTIVSNPDNLVSLASNVITINKPGLYRVSWNCVFQICGDFTTRVVNVDSAGEVHNGLMGRSPTGSFVNYPSGGDAFIEVLTTKRIRLEYRVETVGSGANELGHPFNLGVTNIHAQVAIEKIAAR